ncbi:MAG: hypothetical protein KAI17_18110, partial [Thiotrichaceae bacterium]|nr:hypothetical protein [Thiotrichaceae bacterium]
MRKVLFLLLILVFLVFNSGLFANEFFWGTECIGTVDTTNLDNATGGATSGNLWNVGDDVTITRAYLTKSDCIVVRNFEIPVDYEGTIGLVKIHVEYTYDRATKSTDLFELKYCVDPLKISETDASIISAAGTAAPTYSYVEDISEYNIDDSVVTYDFVQLPASFTWDDLRNLQLIFQNNMAGGADGTWAAVDSIWLEVGRVLEVTDTWATTQDKVGIGIENNPQFLLKLEVADDVIAVGSITFDIVQNTTKTNDWGCNKVSVYSDILGNGKVDSGSDVLLAEYLIPTINDAAAIDGITLNLNANVEDPGPGFYIAGSNFLLVTAQAPESNVLSKRVTFELRLPPDCLTTIDSFAPVYLPPDANDLPLSTTPQQPMFLLYPNVQNLQILKDNTDALLTSTTVMSGDLFVLKASIMPELMDGNTIRWNSDHVTGWPDPDCLSDDGATVAAVTYPDDVVFKAQDVVTTTEPMIVSKSNRACSVHTTLKAGHPGTAYFGVYGTGWDTTSDLAVEGNSIDSRSDTTFDYSGDGFLHIVPGLTVSGTNVDTADVFKGESKKPFLEINLSGVNQYLDITILELKVATTAGTTNVANDVGDVYLYTDLNNDGSIEGAENSSEIQLAFGSIATGSHTFSLISNRIIPYFQPPDTDNSKNYLLCADISPSAVAGNKIGFTMTDNSFLTLSGGVAQVKPANFAISSTDRIIVGPAKLEILETSLSFASLLPGATVTVGFRLQNTSSRDADNVTISVLSTDPLGNASATRVTAQQQVPTDGLCNAGYDTWFYWDYTVGHTGQIKFSCQASGRDALSMTPISSPVVWTGYLDITGNVTVNRTMPVAEDIGSGESVVEMMVLEFTKDDDTV